MYWCIFRSYTWFVVKDSHTIHSRHVIMHLTFDIFHQVPQFENTQTQTHRSERYDNTFWAHTDFTIHSFSVCLWARIIVNAINIIGIYCLGVWLWCDVALKPKMHKQNRKFFWLGAAIFFIFFFFNSNGNRNGLFSLFTLKIPVWIESIDDVEFRFERNWWTRIKRRGMQMNECWKS